MENVQMHEVKSGNLRYIGYDDVKREFYIGFWADKSKDPEKEPKYYRYQNVTKSMFMDMLMNPHPGKTVMATVVRQKEKYPFEIIKSKKE